MSALARAQHALLDALLQPRPPQDGWDAAGIDVYRVNAHAHAERTLAATYPVVHALVGDDAHHALARALWHHLPPARGDLAEWGGALAGFIDAQADLAGLPWLGDVARVEWALHQAGRAADARPDPASFGLLHLHAPEHLRARLAPGTAVIESPWPVLSVIDAHLHGEPGFDEVADRLCQRVSEPVRVWRPDGQVRAAVIDAGVARFEALLAAGASLGHALDAAPIDIAAWLPEAVQHGRLLGIAPLAHTPPTGDPT